MISSSNNFVKFNFKINFSLVLLCLLFFSFSTSAQTLAGSSNGENATQSKNEENVSPKMEFAIWFMGTNQIPNMLIAPGARSPKRQLLSSGAFPNRLLIESLLKKAVAFDTSMA